MNNQTVSLKDATRKGLYEMLYNQFGIKGISRLKKEALVELAEELNIHEVIVMENGKYEPIFDEIKPGKDAKRVRTTAEAFLILEEIGGQTLVEEISKAMLGGVKLSKIVANPTKYLALDIVPNVLEFAKKYDVSV